MSRYRRYMSHKPTIQTPAFPCLLRLWVYFIHPEHTFSWTSCYSSGFLFCLDSSRCYPLVSGVFRFLLCANLVFANPVAVRGLCRFRAVVRITIRVYLPVLISSRMGFQKAYTLEPQRSLWRSLSGVSWACNLPDPIIACVATISSDPSGSGACLA